MLLVRPVAAFPPNGSAWTAQVQDLLRECSADLALTDRISHLTLAEINRLVPPARERRDRRVSELPPPIQLSWKGSIDEPGGTRAVHSTSAGEIIIQLTTDHSIGGADIRAHLSSTRAGRTKGALAGTIELDGVCSVCVVEHLEMGGWPADVTLGVGRAVASKAHTDGVAAFERIHARWRQEHAQLIRLANERHVADDDQDQSR